MPNGLAYLMLLVWPVIMVFLFRRMPAHKAMLWSLIGAYLFLPPQPATFDFPLLPPFTKDSIPNLMLLLICLIKFGPGVIRLPNSTIARVLLFLFVFSPIATILVNGKPLIFRNGNFLPGLRFTDMVALVITQAMLLLPVILARNILASEESHRDMLKILMAAGLIYSIPMLIEIRLSPQLNLWVYGFFQHSFVQSIRFGGFRPVVFLDHGLWVAFFAMTSTVAAFALWRVDHSTHRAVYLLAAGYLAIVLVLSKSLGALLFAILLVPLIVLLNHRIQILLAFVLVLPVLSYPALKTTNLIPNQWMIEQAQRVNENRANSLKFRFYNEDILLERALEKPLFGWGSWGRNHLHNPDSGEITSVTDGRWIIVFGVFGWIGFIAEFGLLTLPLMLLWRISRKMPVQEISPYVGPIALILAINVVDLLPNATLTPLTWLLSGALLGYAEKLKINPAKQIKPRHAWVPIMQ